MKEETGELLHVPFRPSLSSTGNTWVPRNGRMTLKLGILPVPGHRSRFYTSGRSSRCSASGASTKR